MSSPFLGRDDHYYTQEWLGDLDGPHGLFLRCGDLIIRQTLETREVDMYSPGLYNLIRAEHAAWAALHTRPGERLASETEGEPK